MFRYMGFIWNQDASDQTNLVHVLAQRLQSSSPKWHEVFGANQLRVFCADTRAGSAEPHMLAENGGVIIGALFERNRNLMNGSTPRRALLGPRESGHIIESQGRRLTEAFWGRYVAFLVNRDVTKTWVIRDPSGGFPCYWTVSHGVTIFFSYIPDCIRLDTVNFSINWDYMRTRVARGPFAASGSALNEVNEVQGGECIEVTCQSLIRRVYWQPSAIANTEVLENPANAAKHLRSTVMGCANAWSSCYQNILMRLSGGLDSSIVLSALMNSSSRPNVTCLTYHSPLRGTSQECFYASLASSRVHCNHIKHLRDTDIDFSQILKITPTVNPSPDLSFLEVGRFERRLAGELGATAICTGQGGDALFGRYSARHALGDYVLRHGVHPRLFRVVMEMSLVENISMWNALARGFWDLFGTRNRHLIRTIVEVRKLASRALIEAAVSQKDTLLHPWLTAERVSPGTAIMMFGLMAPPHYYDELSRADDQDPEELPLLHSQPILETCLRIPSYVHIDRGQDRSIARQAFAKDVPYEIISRQWKDRGPGFFSAVLARNLVFVREFLNDGVLMKEGLLDRAKVDEALSETPTRNTPWVGELHDHLMSEAWARCWIGASHGRQRLTA